MPDTLTGRKEFIMSKRTANTAAPAAQNAQTNDSATFTVSGILDHVYTGKKYNYAYVKVTKANGYYDLYKVQCGLEYDFPDDGQPITMTGTMSQFKGEISFVSND